MHKPQMEKVRVSTYERVKAMMSVERWGRAALPRMTLEQLRLLTETVLDAYCAGYLAGQLRERIDGRARAAEDFFMMLVEDPFGRPTEEEPRKDGKDGASGHDGVIPVP